MNFTKAIQIILITLLLHELGLYFGLYGILGWYDVLLHFAGGFSAGALGLAVWNEGVHEIRFQKDLKKHLEWWLIPLFVLGFAGLVGIGWEWHEFLLDKWISGVVRQSGLPDTMADLFFDLLGAAVVVLIFHRPYAKR